MKTYSVHILKCADNTYYTGVTSDLPQRVLLHQNGTFQDSYTSKRRLIELVFYCEFTNIEIAIAKEKQLKK